MRLKPTSIAQLLCIAAVSAALACDAASAEPTGAPLKSPPKSPEPSAPEAPAANTRSSPVRMARSDAAATGAAQPTAQPAPAPAPTSPTAGPASARERLAAFWSEFRSAVEHDDKQKLAALTKFPFETRGTDDHNPVRKHKPLRFAQVIDKLLEDDAGGREPVSMRQLILQTPEVGGRGFSEVQARVGNFSFHDLEGGWRFVRAYTDMFEPDYVYRPRLPEEKP